MKYYESCIDPTDNAIAAHITYRSTSAGGAGTGIIEADDITIPAANFPPSDSDETPIRNIVILPFEIDAAESATFYNETQGFSLSVIFDQAALTVRTVRIYTSASIRRNVAEFHVGVGSSAVGDVISYTVKGVNGVISADRMNNIKAIDIECYDFEYAASTYIASSTALTFDTNAFFEVKRPILALLTSSNGTGTATKWVPYLRYNNTIKFYTDITAVFVQTGETISTSYIFLFFPGRYQILPLPNAGPPAGTVDITINIISAIMSTSTDIDDYILHIP